MRTFHDAVVLGFDTSAPRRAVLSIGCVSVYEGEVLVAQETGELIVEGVSRLTENGSLVSGPTYGFDDGGLLQLQMTDTTVVALIEWETYATKRVDLCEYEIRGDKVSWVVRDRSPEL